MKYSVAKVKDIEKYLTPNQQQQMGDLLREITAGRIKDGKRAENEYWIVNKDESYSRQVEALIKSEAGLELKCKCGHRARYQNMVNYEPAWTCGRRGCRRESGAKLPSSEEQRRTLHLYTKSGH